MLRNDSRKILKAFVFQLNHYIFIKAENLCAVKTLKLTTDKCQIWAAVSGSIISDAVYDGMWGSSVHAVC